MNANDLPPAAKLAALIEAGRAANPDLKHGVLHLLHEGSACAIGFAALAAGADRRELETTNIHDNTPYWREAYRALQGPLPGFKSFCRVWSLNDAGASLEEICHSLREGELAKVPA